MRNNEKKVRGKNWKSYCKKESCTDCSGMFFVRTANRYCYEDRFDLPQVPHKIIYKASGRVHVVGTGIIGHATLGNHKNNHMAVWEENIGSNKPENNDNYLYIIKEVCKELKIDFKKFMRILNKITKEVLHEN